MTHSVTHAVRTIACFTVAYLSTLSNPLTAQEDTLTHRSAEIRVTAIRAEEDILEVPLAITVVQPKLFEASRLTSLDEALSLVPGAVVQSRSGGMDVRVQIRGFGARGAGERSNAGTSRGLRFYMDGIPETEPDGRTSFDLIDLAAASRIEVVRSNASTLWGNASGGIVSISTIPTENVPFIRLTTSIASFGFVRQALLANAPLSNGQIYTSVQRMSLDGWRAQSNGDLLQGNVGFVSALGDRSQLRVHIVGAENMFRIPGALTLEQFRSDPQQAQDDTTIYKPTYVARDERRHNRLGRLGVVFDHDFNNTHGISATAFVQTKFLQRSERNTFRDFTRYHVGGNAMYRLSHAFSSTLATKAMVGVDEQYQDGAILFYTLDPLTKGRGTTLNTNKREGAENLGAFLQNEWIVDNWSMTGGLRYDRISYFSDDYTGRFLSEARVFEALTPKLGVTMRADEGTSIYANIGGGIEVPAGNELDPPSATGEDTLYLVNPLLKPIRSTTFEVGAKWAEVFTTGAIQTLAMDLAFFYIDVRNDIVPYRNGRFYQTAGRSSRIGFEFGGSAELRSGLSMYGAFTAMRSTYDEYVIDSAFIDPAKAGRTRSFSGNEMAGIPSLSFTARVRQRDLFITGLFAEVEARLIGSYAADDANTLQVGTTNVFDVAIGMRGKLTSWLDVTTTLRMTNIFNDMYMASAWINPDRTPGGTPYIEPGMPRAMNLNVQLTFLP